MECSFFQLYNDNIEDLLSSKKRNLNIRENPDKGVYIEELKEVQVTKPYSVYKLMGKGFQKRSTASTALNDVSSRSHAIFRITLEQIKVSKNSEGKIGIK